MPDCNCNRESQYGCERPFLFTDAYFRRDIFSHPIPFRCLCSLYLLSAPPPPPIPFHRSISISPIKNSFFISCFNSLFRSQFSEAERSYHSAPNLAIIPPRYDPRSKKSLYLTRGGPRSKFHHIFIHLHSNFNTSNTLITSR